MFKEKHLTAKHRTNCMEYIEKLYSEVSDEGRLSLTAKRTTSFLLFNHNLSRALMLPTLVYGPESDDDWGYSDYLFLNHAAVIQVLTSLESYYHSIFEIITKVLKTSEVNASALSQFIRGNKLLVEFTNALERQHSINFCLCEILPKYYQFQEKDKIKLAMALIDLDPIGRFDQEWARTYGDDPDSTASLRHAFIHNSSYDSYDWTPERIKLRDRIKDAIVLVTYVDHQITEKYDDKRFSNFVYVDPIVGKKEKKTEKA
jgi:hypothetical protein